MVCVRYRPRQPRASPVWQIFHDHAAKVPGLSPEAAAAISAFLDCGDLHAGFTRLLCPDCGHEFLLALNCGSYYTSFGFPDMAVVAPSLAVSGFSYM
jgi:hypothetical protein